MKKLKCKQCENRIAIMPEWDEMDVSSIRVKCSACGAAYRYRPLKHKLKQNENYQGTQDISSGTTILDTEINKDSPKSISKAKIEVLTGPTNQMELTIQAKDEPYNIYCGRNPLKLPKENPELDEYYILSDSYVSRYHFKLKIKKHKSSFQVIIEDTGSTNGTKVNDVLMEQGDLIILKDGATIELGDTKLQFRHT